MLEHNDIRTYEADDVVMRSLNNKMPTIMRK